MDGYSDVGALAARPNFLQRIETPIGRIVKTVHSHEVSFCLPQRTSATSAVALFVRHGNKRFSSHNLRICIARVPESALRKRRRCSLA